MLFSSAVTLLLASTAAALPPTRIGVTTNSTQLHARGLNYTEPVVLPRSLNFTGKPILPRGAQNWNFTDVAEAAEAAARAEKAGVFPRMVLNKNTTEGVFDKRDVDEGAAAPTGIVKRSSPTGYVKRSYGTGEVPVPELSFSTFLTIPTPAPTPIVISSPTSTPTPTPDRGRSHDACGGGSSGMDVWDRCIERLFVGFLGR